MSGSPMSTMTSASQHDSGNEGEATVMKQNCTPKSDLGQSDRMVEDQGKASEPLAADSSVQHESDKSKCLHSIEDDASQLIKANGVLATERDKAKSELDRTLRQLDSMRRDNKGLKRQVRDLHLQLSEGNSGLKRQVATLSRQNRELRAESTDIYHNGMMDGVRTQCAQNERVILIQQVEAYRNEAAKWKHEAFGKGSEVVRECWQSSVDEAVRREREKDSVAIRNLQKENELLRAKNKSSE